MEAVRNGAADVEDIALRDGAGLVARCEPGAALEDDVDLVFGVRGLGIGGAGFEDVEARGECGGAEELVVEAAFARVGCVEVGGGEEGGGWVGGSGGHVVIFGEVMVCGGRGSVILRAA